MSTAPAAIKDKHFCIEFSVVTCYFFLCLNRYIDTCSKDKHFCMNVVAFLVEEVFHNSIGNLLIITAHNFSALPHRLKFLAFSHANYNNL